MTGKLARLMVGTCMTAALTVSGFFAGMPAAHAGGGGGSTATCSFNVVVVCLGTLNINGNTVEIDVLNVDVSHITTVVNFLNGNEVNILNGITVSDIQLEVNQIASDNAISLNHIINVCQVKVIELGVVNTNIAKCG
jgi:hypothetical protein